MITGLRTLDCIAFGVPFQLAADSLDLLTRMQACVPLTTEFVSLSASDAANFAIVRGSVGVNHRLLLQDELVAEDAYPEPLLEHIATALMVYVADHAADRDFIHAGVVGWNGSAIVFPGTSFAGKTTLVAELVRAGATYYSDEYAVLDHRGCVHPYPRDLQMRSPGIADQRPVTVAQLNGTVGDLPLTISHVAFIEYVEGSSWNPQSISPGLAALEMMRHAIPVQRAPGRVMATLAKVMETATGFRSERGEASKIARLLLATLDGNP